MGRLHSFFFGSLPSFFKINDSNPDGQGRGTLERYLTVFEEDANTRIGYISSAISESFVIPPLDLLPFPKTTSPKTLNHLASTFGYPPDTFERDDLYRELLKDIQKINRYKGSMEGLKRFFLSMGIQVEDLELIFPSSKNYDDSHAYDEGHLYDEGISSYCVWYTLHLKDDNGVIPMEDLSRTWTLLSPILDYILPVHFIPHQIYVNDVPLREEVIATFYRLEGEAPFTIQQGLAPLRLFSPRTPFYDGHFFLGWSPPIPLTIETNTDFIALWKAMPTTYMTIYIGFTTKAQGTNILESTLLGLTYPGQVIELNPALNNPDFPNKVNAPWKGLFPSMQEFTEYTQFIAIAQQDLPEDYTYYQNTDFPSSTGSLSTKGAPQDVTIRGVLYRLFIMDITPPLNYCLSINSF